MAELFKHQVEGIEFLKKRKRAFLADEPGLGKTRQAIVAAGEDGKGEILVICPASMKITWEREIHAVYPEDKVYIFGNGENIPADTVWYVINYDILEKNSDILDLHDWDTVIPDESQYIKGNSIRSRMTVRQCKRAKKVYLLSGTIVQNRPIELWHQLEAINHPLTIRDVEHKSPWITFGRRYCAGFQRPNPFTGRAFWDFTGASNLDELHVRLRDYYLRRKKEDVLDLPEKIVQIVPITISDEWRARYDTAFDDYIQWLQNHPEIMEEKNMANILKAEHLVEIQKVKQVASLAKIDQIAEESKALLDEGEKIVAFTTFTATHSALKKAMGPKYKKVELIGGTSGAKRQEAVDQFQKDEKTKVFMANIKAAGVGLTLTASTKVQFADLDWNPANMQQAMDRVHRIGQTGTVNVYIYVATGTIDEDIIEMLDEKQKIIDAVMEGGEVKNQGRGAAKDIIRKLGTSGMDLEL